MHDSQEKLKNAEEEINESKLEIQRLNRTISNLSEQIVNGDVMSNSKVAKSNLQIKTSENLNYNSEQCMKALTEENEALRKGLHEILETLNKKKGMYICI